MRYFQSQVIFRRYEWNAFECVLMTCHSVVSTSANLVIGFSNNKFRTLYGEKLPTTCLSLWIIWDHAQTSCMKKSLFQDFRSCYIFWAIQHVFDSELCMIEASTYSFAWVYQLAALQQLSIFHFSGPLKKSAQHAFSGLIYGAFSSSTDFTLPLTAIMYYFEGLAKVYLESLFEKFVHSHTLVLKEWWKQTRSFQDW